MWSKGTNSEQSISLNPEQLNKLQDRNKLLDVLENQGQQIVVVGDTSSGKSTTINFLLGYPFNFVAQGVGTRRPCVMTLTPDPDRTKIAFRVKFHKHDYIEEAEHNDLEAVASFVQAVNDPRRHPEWFDCLDPAQNNHAQKYPVRADEAFDDTPVFIQMLHKEIDCPMRLVDVPGLTRGNRLPTQIALSYIKPDNIVILVIGKDHPNNGGFPHLASAMRQCCQTIIIQNFANTKIQDNQVMENYSVIYDKMQGAQRDFSLYCIDYGIPYEPDLPLWQKGNDQEDWHRINKEKGVEAVRNAMIQHTEMKATQLVERFQHSNVFSQVIVPGLEPVREKLGDFQTKDLDSHIRRLVEELRKTIIKHTAELRKAEHTVKQLQFPPEWDAMLAAFASSVRKYLDATFAATEVLEMGERSQDDSSILWSTLDEMKRISRTSQENADGFPNDYSSKKDNGDGVFWFNDAIDKKIIDLLSKFCGFEADLRLACLRSWQRLVNEFTGMLAFAPMPCVPASSHDMAKMRVGTGQSGQLNFTEETVKLVVSLEQRPGQGLVRPLLEHLERRMRLLIEKDYRNAVNILEFHCQKEFERFFDLVGQDNEDECVEPNGKSRKELFQEMITKLKSGVHRALLMHADRVVTATLHGEIQRDCAGEPVIDQVTHRRRLKERSGIMIRTSENSTCPGPLHWMLPFKFNNNGQIALRSLGYNRSNRSAVQGERSGFLKSIGLIFGGVCEKQQNDDELVVKEQPWNSSLLQEINLNADEGAPTINCSNAVNLRIFRLSTEGYQVPMNPNSPPWAYDVEVLKLLKALQIELAAAWASMWRGMLQELVDRDRVRAWIQSKLKPDMTKVSEDEREKVVELESYFGNNYEMCNRFEDQSMLEACDAVVSWLAGSRAIPSDMMTTDEEIKRSGEDSKWPDHMHYIDVLSKLGPQKVKTAFLQNKDTKLAGQPSWLRLCDEFVFVILQLQMKRISADELSMAKASAGMMSDAGPQEMIAKLTLHRMSQLNLHSQQVFRRRFDYLFKRDLKAAFGNIEEAAQGLKDLKHQGLPAPVWLEGRLMEYKDFVISSTLAALEERFDGLQPFDFAILNGRFPMNSRKLRKTHYELQDDGKSVKVRNATQDIHEMWTAPRYPKLPEVEATRPEGSRPGVMQLSVVGTHAAYENLQEQRERVEQLKAMMACLYQEDHLRRALQESGSLDYLKDFGGHILKKEQQKIVTLRTKLNNMEAVLDSVKLPESAISRQTSAGTTPFGSRQVSADFYNQQGPWSQAVPPEPQRWHAPDAKAPFPPNPWYHQQPYQSMSAPLTPDSKSHVPPPWHNQYSQMVATPTVQGGS